MFIIVCICLILYLQNGIFFFVKKSKKVIRSDNCIFKESKQKWMMIQNYEVIQVKYVNVLEDLEIDIFVNQKGQVLFSVIEGKILNLIM